MVSITAIPLDIPLANIARGRKNRVNKNPFCKVRERKGVKITKSGMDIPQWWFV